MPIYTYECQSCSSTLERRQSFHDEPLTVHDECGGSLRRVIHPAGIVFKGSGFYNTDYKNSTSSNKSASDATESKTDSATSESGSGTTASTNGTASKTEAPAASKTESKPAAASASPAPATP